MLQHPFLDADEAAIQDERQDWNHEPRAERAEQECGSDQDQDHRNVHRVSSEAKGTLNHQCRGLLERLDGGVGFREEHARPHGHADPGENEQSSEKSHRPMKDSDDGHEPMEREHE